MIIQLTRMLCAATLFFTLVMRTPAVTLDWSLVGNPGNANDPADGDSGTAEVEHYGAVPYAFNIGTKQVTASQYVEFLNTKDSAGVNSLNLYNANMSDVAYGGIGYVAGNASGNKYVVIAGRGNHPANYITWYEAVRFANWAHNGQGSGSTERGAYTLGALGAGSVPINPPITHNVGALVWLPTENEWYKAAYYNAATSSYFQYPTSTNSTPIASGPTPLPNHANVNPGGAGNVTDVGAYSGTTSPYGVYDLGGNLYQWNEALIGSARVVRGGSWADPVEGLLSSSRFNGSPTYQGFENSFRLASATTSLLAGDYNNNGVVDAADYVLWRNGGPLLNDGTPGTQPTDFDVWRSHFGQTTLGAAVGIATVPEPVTLLIIFSTVLGYPICCRNSIRRNRV